MTDKLKPCPFCGCKANKSPLLIKEKDYDVNIFDNEDKCRQAQVFFHFVCLRCKAKSGEHSNKEKAIAAWNRRAELKPVETDQFKNAPLSLDELRAMNACPVWCVDHQGNGKWALVHTAEEVCTDADFDDWEFYCYGWTDSDVGWLAYRTKPEEEKA